MLRLGRIEICVNRCASVIVALVQMGGGGVNCKKNCLISFGKLLVGVLVGLLLPMSSTTTIFEEKHKKFSTPLLIGNMYKCR